MYIETKIQPHHAGFNMYQSSRGDEEWADRCDLESAMADSRPIICLTSADAEEIAEFETANDVTIDRICGRIYDEPTWVYAILDTPLPDQDYDGIIYAGILEI
jgi:hypothetical protein